MAEVTLSLEKIKSLINDFDDLENKITKSKYNKLKEIYEKNKSVSEGLFKKRLVTYDTFEEFMNKFFNKCDYINSPNKDLFIDINSVFIYYSNKEKTLTTLKDFFTNSINLEAVYVTLTSDEIDSLNFLINLKKDD